MTLAYLFFRRQPVAVRPTLVFFASMFLFDLTATAINNYIGAGKEGEKLPLRRKTAKWIIYVLFAVSAALGLYLTFLTDAVVFLAGGLCFLCGVLYTWGPLPISRLPLGEALSGLFYGFFIPFLMLYINLPAGAVLTLRADLQTVHLDFNILPLLALLLLSAVPFCATANIMLANNLCDLQKDISVGRRTLPFYLGKRALSLYAGLYYAAYAAVILLCVFRILHPVCLLYLLTLFPVKKNIRKFQAEQVKAETFVLSIQNYILMMGTLTLLIFLSAFLV